MQPLAADAETAIHVGDHPPARGVAVVYPLSVIGITTWVKPGPDLHRSCTTSGAFSCRNKASAIGAEGNLARLRSRWRDLPLRWRADPRPRGGLARQQQHHDFGTFVQLWDKGDNHCRFRAKEYG
jgi:hypothetical protein